MQVSAACSGAYLLDLGTNDSRQCTKANVDCVYKDHGRGVTVSRRYDGHVVSGLTLTVAQLYFRTCRSRAQA